MLVYQRVSLTYFATLVPSKATCSHRSSPVAGHGGIAAQRRQGGGALGAEGRYVRAAQGGRPGDRIRPEDRDRNPGGLTWFLVGGFHVWFPCQTHCDILYIYWLVVWNHGILWLSIYWECHNPNWLSYFSEGLKPPTWFEPLKMPEKGETDGFASAKKKWGLKQDWPIGWRI